MVLRRLAKDSFIYGSADFLTKLLVFFSFPLLATVLSPKAFGALELISTATALLGLFLNCGLNNSVQRFYWDKDTSVFQQSVIVTSGLVAQIIFGLIAVILGIVLLPFALPWMMVNEWPITWAGLVAALVLMALSQWQQFILDVIRLHFAPWRFFIVAFVSRVGSILFGLFAVISLGMNIDGLLAAQVLGLLLSAPLAIRFAIKDINISKFNISWFKELVKFGHPFIFASLAYWLFSSIDRWMLASMTSVEQVGIYSIAFRFASVISFVSVAFGQAWSPAAIKIRTDNPATYRAIYGQVFLLLTFVMLFSGGMIALFSGEIISFFMPREYLTSALPFAILCFGLVFQATQQVSTIGILLQKKTYLLSRLTWVTAMCNILLNLWLIPHLGAIGAALATSISYLLLSISLTFFTQRCHPLVVPWGRLFILLFIGIIIASVSLQAIATDIYWPIVLIKILFFVVCFLAGLSLLPLRLLKLI